MLKSKFAKFIIAGGVAAAANFGSRFIFSNFLEYEVSVFFAYLVGMSVAFYLMRGHVFNESSGSLLSQIIKFVGINILAVAQTLIISLLLVRWLFPVLAITQHTEALAHFVGVLVPVFTSYVGHKFFTFR